MVNRFLNKLKFIYYWVKSKPIPIQKQLQSLISDDANYFVWLVKHKLIDYTIIRSLGGREKQTLFFSIILPVYNTQGVWLEKAITSVMRQTFSSFELIICDDASDNQETQVVLNQLLTVYRNIKIVRNEQNKGISESTNKAAKQARGQYLVFLDHDDELYPDSLESLYHWIQKYPEVGLFYSDEDRITPQGFKTRYNFKPNFSPSLLENTNYILHLVCLKREIFFQTGGMRKDFDGSQDYDLWLRLMDQEITFFHIPDILYSWRECESSMIGGDLKPEAFERGKKALEEHLNRRKESFAQVVHQSNNLRGHYHIKFHAKARCLILSTQSKSISVDSLTIKNIQIISATTPVDSNPIKVAFHYISEVDVILFMDPDIQPSNWEEFLNELIGWSLRKDVGIVSGKLVSNNNQILHAGLTLDDKQNFQEDFYQADGYDPLANQIRDKTAVLSRILVISSLHLQQCWHKDLSYHLYWDIELCLLAHKENLRVVYNPFAVAIYHGHNNTYALLPTHSVGQICNRYRINSDLYSNPNLQFKANVLQLQEQLPKDSQQSLLSNYSYMSWLRWISSPTSRDFSQINTTQIRFSIILPTYNSNIDFLREMIESIQNQTMQAYEICISDDGSIRPDLHQYLHSLADKDQRFKITISAKHQGVAVNTNRAITMAKGDFLVFCDHEDRLEPIALECLTEYILQHEDTDLLYTDEDMIDAEGKRSNPHLRSDWNPDLFTSQMYFIHLVAMRTKLVNLVGNLNLEMEGAQTYDLILRLTEQAHHVGHIPRILYSWRCYNGAASMDNAARTNAYAAGQQALNQALKRRKNDGLTLFVSGTPQGIYRVKRKVVKKELSHIVAVKSHQAISAINSIRQIASFPVEIIAVVEDDKQQLIQQIEQVSDVTVVTVTQGSNRGVFYNQGARCASFDQLFFSIDSIEIIGSEYPTAAIEHTQRAEIGATGVKIVYSNGCYYHTGLILGVNGMCGYAHRNIREYPGYWNYAQSIRNYSAVSGDLFAVNKQKWQLVDGFDEGLIYYSDVDFCLKLMLRGFRNLYTPYITGVLKRAVHLQEELRDEQSTTILLNRYGKTIMQDPYYHPHLSKELEDFSISYFGEKKAF